MTQPLKVALLGCGVVGSEVARLLTEHADDLTARVGRPLELAGVAVRRPNRARGVDASLVTTDAAGLVSRDDIDLVVEVIGGIEPARSLILTGMEHGASVVTANKALLAEDGATLHAAAEKYGVDLYYEASVAGAIPLLRPMRESLAGDKVRRVLGIVNGTTNFILTRMDETGAGFSEALDEARPWLRRGRPRPPMSRASTRAKAAILAGSRSTPGSPPPTCTARGSPRSRPPTCARPRTSGASSSCSRSRSSPRTAPAWRPHAPGDDPAHPSARQRPEAFNAVFVECEAAGELMFYGRGAGGAPTASAVLGDVVAVGRHKVAAPWDPASLVRRAAGAPDGGVAHRYHVSLDVADRAVSSPPSPGVREARRLDPHRPPGGSRRRRLAGARDPHGARRRARATVDDLRHLDVVREVTSVMRVEGQQ
jgi:homoserine dehydrogenase